MYYSSISQVRKTSGIFASTNITDPFVQGKILEADSLINSMISDVYTLPLDNFWQNTLTFSGAGTGAGTMTISIGGKDYAITIANLQTADTSADLFRKSVYATTSPTFEIGSIDDTTVAILVGKTTALTDVTVASSDPQTVSGIVCTSSDLKQIAHPLISHLSAEIASAYVLMVAYGKESENTDKDGAKRLDAAMKILEEIQNKKIKLYDGSGSELSQSENGRFAFYPNYSSSTGDGDETDTSNRFGVNQDF